MGVIRLGYVHVRVTDLDEATRHYSQTMGMDVVAEDDGRTYLKSWDEFDHHSVVLEGGGVGLVKAGYKVTYEDALAEAETRSPFSGPSVSSRNAWASGPRNG